MWAFSQILVERKKHKFIRKQTEPITSSFAPWAYTCLLVLCERPYISMDKGHGISKFFIVSDYRIITLAPEVRSQNTYYEINRDYGLVVVVVFFFFFF